MPGNVLSLRSTGWWIFIRRGFGSSAASKSAHLARWRRCPRGCCAPWGPPCPPSTSSTTRGWRSGSSVLANRTATLIFDMLGRQTTSFQRWRWRSLNCRILSDFQSGRPDCQLRRPSQFWWIEWSEGGGKCTWLIFFLFSNQTCCFRWRATIYPAWTRRVSRSTWRSPPCTRAPPCRYHEIKFLNIIEIKQRIIGNWSYNCESKSYKIVKWDISFKWIACTCLSIPPSYPCDQTAEKCTVLIVKWSRHTYFVRLSVPFCCRLHEMFWCLFQVSIYYNTVASLEWENFRLY